jgi:adenylosuccinate lyase
MMKYLGLTAVDVSNQVISRDRYAEYFFFLANVATTLDKIGSEIRSLSVPRSRKLRRLSVQTGRILNNAAKA